MTKCTHCLRSAELFLCTRCQTELRDTLNDLPGWITALQEDAWGQTRMGESVRRSTDLGSPALCKLGPSGSFARSPGQLLVYTHSVAVEWTRDLCETRGVEIPILSTSGLMRWLSRHVTAIASDPGAAVCYREIQEIRADIEARVDRPCSPLFAGICPTEGCAAELVIPPGGVKQFQCRGCGSIHLVHELLTRRLNEAPPDLLFTAGEVLIVMNMLRMPVPERTWRRWRAQGHVQPAGELYGERAYRIQDVREMRLKWSHRRAG